MGGDQRAGKEITNLYKVLLSPESTCSYMALFKEHPIVIYWSDQMREPSTKGRNNLLKVNHYLLEKPQLDLRSADSRLRAFS